MTDEEKKAFAKELILHSFRDFEYLTIVETRDGISDDDADDVYYLIGDAKVEVSW